MTNTDDMERDRWTRAARMTKQEKLEEIRKMRDWLRAGEQKEKERK
jgi:hypothetical protein